MSSGHPQIRQRKQRHQLCRVLGQVAEAPFHIGDPVGTAFEAAVYAQLRRKRLDEGISGKTLNNELGYTSAVFNELKAPGEIDYDNPLARVRLLELQERELSWRTSAQIAELLQAIRSGCENPHTELVALLCLATGARWSEAEQLTPHRVQGNVVTYAGTKSGRVSHVPIRAEIADRFQVHWKANAHTSRLSVVISNVLRFSCQKDKQATHCGTLYNEWRQHPHITENSGPLYACDDDAHLSPDHLHDAMRFGPLY